MTPEANARPVETPPTRLRRAFSQEALTSLAFFLFLWFFWGVRYGDYLYAAQENSMFLYNAEFFSRWLQVPEGFLCYVCAFTIQFFYYPLLGGLILASLASGSQLFLARLANLKGTAYLFSFVPGALVAISTTWPGYYVYIPYNLSMIFAELFAIPAALGCYALYRAFAGKRYRAVVGLALCAVLYPTFGFWGFFVGLLCAASEAAAALTARNDKPARKNALITGAVLVAGAVLIPWIYYRVCYFSSILKVNVYLQGLLEDIRYDKNSITSRLFYGTAELAPLVILALIFIARLRAGLPKKEASAERTTRREARLQARVAAKEAKKAKRKSKGKDLSAAKGDKSGVAPTLSAAEMSERVEREKAASRVRLLWELWLVIVACVFVTSYHTKSFFTVLKATRATVNEDWEEVLRLEERNPFPSKACVQLRNLALSYTGQLAERVFERPISGLSTLPLTDLDYAKSLGGNPYYKLKVALYNLQRETETGSDRVLCELLYCYWGQTNIGARIAMNNLIATEDRSVSYTRTLALAALVNGEENLARRYLNTLAQTTFYSDWARTRLAFVDSPIFYDGVRDYHDDKEFEAGLLARRASRNEAPTVAEAASRYGVKSEAVEAAAKSIAQMRVRRPARNYTTTSRYPNLVYLYEIVKEDEYEDSPAERQEVILVSALIQKKSDFFLEHIEPIMKKYPNGGAPKAYEQGYATWRFQKYDNKWKDCEYKFSPETVDLFTQFVNYLHALREIPGASVSANDVQETFRNNCRGLYWGYASDESVFRQY